MQEIMEQDTSSSRTKRVNTAAAEAALLRITPSKPNQLMQILNMANS